MKLPMFCRRYRRVRCQPADEGYCAHCGRKKIPNLESNYLLQNNDSLEAYAQALIKESGGPTWTYGGTSLSLA